MEVRRSKPPTAEWKSDVGVMEVMTAWFAAWEPPAPDKRNPQGASLRWHQGRWL
jgi:hypothetical protein